jgi:hypothetical protein
MRNNMIVSDIAHDAGCPVNFSARPDGTHFTDAAADAVAARLGPEIERIGRGVVTPALRERRSHGHAA